MGDVSSRYRGLYLSMQQQPERIAHTLPIINEIAAQFDSSFLGIACTTLSSECIWVQFREFVQKFQTKGPLCDSEVDQQMYQAWHHYWDSLVLFMSNFSVNFCDCAGDEHACAFSRLCCTAADHVTVSESYFSARIISIRVFQSVISLWQGLLEDEGREDGEAEMMAPVTTEFVDAAGNDLVLQGMRAVILSAKIVDHSCVMSHTLKKGTVFE
jgi:hypothetical protein